MLKEYLVFAILIGALALFIWGRWRYDIVALIALMATVACGAVPYRETFLGFANPAVITVAAVMVLTEAIMSSGLIDVVVKRLAPATDNMLLHIAILTIMAAVLSAFMNNVGALALIMPIAMVTAAKQKRSPALLLMPIAFGSILGGMTTLIGTPPNILISIYRQEVVGKPFAMFDFTPVGLGVAIVGIVFIIFIGWRCIPKARLSKTSTGDIFSIDDYIAEVLVPAETVLVGKPISAIEEYITKEYAVLGLIRSNRKRLRFSEDEELQADDILIIEAGSKDLEQLINSAKLQLVGDTTVTPEVLTSDNVGLAEAVIMPGSNIEGRTPARLQLGRRFGVHILAIARAGESFQQRLKNVRLKAGDILLIQGKIDNLSETIADIGFLPLADRGLRIGMEKGALKPVVVFVIAMILTATKVLPVQIAFSGAVLAMILLNIIPIRKVYSSIDWSVIVLLGAMIPVGGALETTGGTTLIANAIASFSGHIPAVVILGLVMIITMTLSDVMNNAATAVVMSPIAVSIAQSLGYNVNPFLMAVAVGASSAFLTPIGHQNNTLVMGPGGYHFGDYWRMGLPLEILIIITALPLILWVWPLW